MSEEKAEKVFRNYTPPDDREAIISEYTNYSNYIKSVRGQGLNWSWGQFRHGCDPYALVKSDKIDICLSEMYEIAVQAIISEYTKYSKYIKSVRGKD